MRPYLVLIAVALLTAFAAGTLSLDLARGAQTEGGAPNIPFIKASFEAQQKASGSLDLSELFPPGDGLRLVDPRETLPQTHRYPADQLGALARFAARCELGAPVTAPSLAKALTWHRFSCGLGALPPSFFEGPPFMHPSGVSFASLAGESRAWALEHQRLFHLTEWKDSAGLSPARVVLARLSRAALTSIALAEPFILDADVVLIARVGSADSGGRRYSIFARSAWNAFISHAPLVARPLRPGAACVLTEGALCWVRNEAPYFDRLSRLTEALLALAISSMGAAGFLLLRRVRGQRSEEERQRFVLQTLTHELRTPVASLLVSVESLRRDFEALGPEAQRDLLRVVDDAHRLRRLAERSRAYLSRTPGPLPQQLASVRDFITQTLEPWREQLRVEVSRDCSITLDPYWVATCLTNLVENAIKHGAAPIVVEVEPGAGSLRVSVTDAGHFAPHSPNAGLGLGLSIVRRAVEAMGGKLDVRHSPTRMTFLIPTGGSR